MSRATPAAAILYAKAATGIGAPQFVQDQHDIVVSLDTTGSTNATIKFQGSLQETMPDFNASQSPTNQWAYIQMVDLNDGSAINGSTGIALSGTDANRMLEANTNGLRWFNAVVTAYVAGAITVKSKPFYNG